jgi:uncharacterized protein (DUF302 family)
MKQLVAAVVLLATAPATVQAQMPPDWHVRTTTHSVANVVQRLTTTIEKGGGSVAAVVDHSANARSAGMALQDTTLVIFGNPKLGTTLMAQNRAIAMDLPQRILVWRDGATTRIGFTRPAAIAARYGIDGSNPSLVAMDKAMSALVDAVSNP